MRVLLGERFLRLQRHLSREWDPRRGWRLANRGHLVDTERFGGLALQLHAGNHVDCDVVLALVVRRLADQEVVGRSVGAETRCRVDRVAQGRVLEAAARAHVADDRRPRVDADAPSNWR